MPRFIAAGPGSGTENRPKIKQEISVMQISEEMDFFIRTIAKNSSIVTSETKNPAESALIISEILKHAKKEVKIFGDIPTDKSIELYDSFYLELDDFLKSGKTLKVALTDSEPKASAFYDILSEYKKNSPAKVEIKLADDNFQKNMYDVMTKRTTFIVDDRNAFKIELTDSREQFPKIHDLYSFNDKEISEKLSSAFNDKLFNNCPSLV